MKKFYILIVLISFLLSPALAQKKGKRSKELTNKVSVMPFLALPSGKLGVSNKTGFGFQVGYSKIFARKKSRLAPAIGAMIGYTRLQSKGDTTHFPAFDWQNNPVVGSSYYSAFNMIQVKLSGGLRFTLIDNLYLTPGAELGAVIGKRDSYIYDGANQTEEGEVKTWLVFVPKVNVEYKLNKHFSVEAFVGYNLIIQAGSTDATATNYNPDTGKTYSYITPGIGLNYFF